MARGVLKRIHSLLAIVVVVAAVATTMGVSSAGPETGAPVVRATIAVPAIQLPFLSDDEEEPDENEADEGAPIGQPQKAAPNEPAVPRWLVYTVAGVALALVVGAIALIVRWVRRYRAWKRRVAVRTRFWVRRLGDDLDRARRRGSRPW